MKYLERTSTREDYFKWPRVEDMAETAACFVFKWDFEVNPVSNNSRMWQVLGIQDIASTYMVLKQGL